MTTKFSILGIWYLFLRSDLFRILEHKASFTVLSRLTLITGDIKFFIRTTIEFYNALFFHLLVFEAQCLLMNEG